MLTNPNLQAAQDFEDQQAATIASRDAALVDLHALLDIDNQTIASANAQLRADAGIIASLGAPASPLVTTFRNIETLDGWILAGGAAGNSGQTGSLGSGSFSYDKAAGVANASVTPNGPYYNCYFYNPLAGTNSNTGKPLPFPAIAPALGQFIYHAEYYVPAAAYAVRNALENEIRWHHNGRRYIMASQLRLGSAPSVHIFNQSLTSGDKWVDTKVACNLQPDAWYSIDTVFKVDADLGVLHAQGFYIEGKYHSLEWLIPSDAYSKPDWFLASVQPDSNRTGAAYTYQVRNLNVTIL